MNFKEMQDMVGLMLNFTSNTADADFTTAQVKASLNRAYVREVRKARTTGNPEYFKSQMTFTWPASQQDFTLTAQMKNSEWIRLDDITNSAIGSEVVFGTSPHQGTLYILDRNTLRWGSTGPSSERTLRLTYYSMAEELIDDEDEPEIIRPDHHELLVYSSAIELRAFADEEIPRVWQSRYEELDMQFFKLTARGRPHIGGDVTVINRDSDSASVEYLYD
jgi:hypothetical protein